MRKTRYLILTLLLISFMPISLAADDGLWAGGTYDNSVPTPKSVLGYELGERHTPHHMLERYIEAVAAASDRVKMTTYGETWQGRKLFHIIVTSPENLAKVEDIRAAVHRLSEIGEVTADEVASITAETPAIAMLNYNVHGNEASGAEAAMRTLYQLAAGTDAATLNILENVVTVIDPVQNPDGHDRFVNYVNSAIVTEPDSYAGSYEHSEPWPGSRTNAYYFDLNRDWFLMTQAEGRARSIALTQWLPQVAPDLHEMGSNATYFFAPPMEPFNILFTESLHKWWEAYGRANAAALDSISETYYTRESFDSFYVGYGESLPIFYGAVGMTYEQASARGRVVMREDGTLLTLHDGMRNHFLTSMATLKTTADNREQLLKDFHGYFKIIVDRGTNGPIREIYLKPDDPARLNKMVGKLRQLDIEVDRATAEFTIKNAYNYTNRKRADVTLPAGTAIVRLDQRMGNVAMAVLEPNAPIDEKFLKEERDRMNRNLPSRFYDITSWSMPLTYGVPAYHAGAKAGVEREPWPAEMMAAPTVAKAKVAYLIPPDTNANIALVAKLANADYKLRVARMEFTLNDRTFPPGTVVIRVGRNPEKLHEDIGKFAAETHGTVFSADTGYTPDGIDLGSNNIMHMKNPKVALMGDSPISSYGFGAMRYLLEQSYGLKYTAFRVEDFGRFELDKYNVLILPDMYGTALKRYLGKGGIDKLKRWVQDGNVLVALGDASVFLGDKEIGLSDAPRYSQRRKEAGEVEDPYAEAPPAEEEKNKEDEKKNGNGKKDEKKYEVEKLYRVPGAILKVRLDDRSFLSWGYADGFALALVNSRNVFEPISDDQGIAAGRYYASDEMLISGHIWPESKELIGGKAYAWHQRQGGGMVICFGEDPTFRASYDGLDRMLFNAIYFASAFTR